ncbi:hypothetical protein KGF57_004762 [Candida theae]|uniref:Uncharacterized protein n=1 Tax=Candida theae TaxID=1198502 RepID=A0AAD5FWE0_9ASCO|nr:uncharacterized protein KGF57_004762 [Candida theae]KAI5949164.1 hypothetical protein KGF57_004762 [Candida theae]
MHESIKVKEKGQVSKEGPVTRSSSGSNVGSNSLEEDWSIISSSSDFDDERSTTSSDGKHNIESDDQFGSSDAGDGSIFKVPKLVPGVDKQGSIRAAPDTRKLSGGSEEFNGSPSSLSTASRSDGDSVSHELANWANVGSKIKFFENMSMFSESIKQKSSDFYSNYAKDKIEQLNKYVSEQNMSVGLDGAAEEAGCERHGLETLTAAPQAEIDTDMEDTIELQARERKEATEAAKQEVYQEPPISNKVQTKTNPTSHKVRIINAVQNFLDTHSEYLCYYLFAILVGLIPAIYTIHHFASVKASKPVTFYDKCNQYWTDLVYEDAPVSSNYFAFRTKKLKVNRFVSYSKQLRTSLEPSLALVRQWSNEVVAEAVPIVNNWLSKTSNAVMLVSKNSQQWLKDASVVAQKELASLKEFASQAGENASVYSHLGMKYASRHGKIFAGQLSNYTIKSVDTLEKLLYSSRREAAAISNKAAKFSAEYSKIAAQVSRKFGKKWARLGRVGLRKSSRLLRKEINKLQKQYPGWQKGVVSKLTVATNWRASFWSKDSFLKKQLRSSSKLVFKKFSEVANAYRGISNEKGLEVL